MGGFGGLHVKIAAAEANSAALDVTQGPTANGVGTSLLRVDGAGRVGISNNNAQQLLHLGTRTYAKPTFVRLSAGNGTIQRDWELGIPVDAATPGDAGGEHYDFALRDATANATRLLVEWNTGNVGIGTSTPVSRLTNTDTNIAGADGVGISGPSLTWAMANQGYAAAFYNSNAAPGGYNDLAVKVAGTDPSNAAFDVSQGSSQAAAGTSLPRVRADGRVGIGTTAPAEKLDVNGNASVSGTLQLNTADVDKILLTNQGAAGSKIGHAAGWGVLTYAGPGTAATGYHSWLTSTATGYQQRMRLTSAGLGLGTSTPRGPLDVAAPGNSYLVADPSNGSGQTVFLPGHLFLGPYDATTPTAFIQARVPNPTTSTNIGLTLRTTNAGTLTDAVQIAATGDVALAGDLDVAGSTGLGLVSRSSSATASANAHFEWRIACPAGTQLLSGGGHRDYNNAQIDIVLNYSGPDPAAPTTTWLLRYTNNSSSTRAVVIYCNCARIR